MAKYTVAHVGGGNRGQRHIEGFLRNPDRFELVAICDLDADRLKAVATQHGVAATYSDADAMLSDTKPDVFCFATQPATRLPLVELGIRHGVKAIAFEKPMATTLEEARRICAACDDAGVKFIVSHQQKYGEQWHKAKGVADRGEIGEVECIRASSRAWLSQLGTHLVDYVLWFNGGDRAVWAVGHVHGREKLADSHPSPDYVAGQIGFENGVRAWVEFGYLSPQRLADNNFWTDNRITLHGTHGYAWAETNGRWGAFTAANPEPVGEQFPEWPEQERNILQAAYLRDLADWLDDDAKIHPCNGAIAYHGYEIMEALCLSALDNRKVDLPLGDLPKETVLDRLARELP